MIEKYLPDFCTRRPVAVIRNVILGKNVVGDDFNMRDGVVIHVRETEIYGKP